MLYRRNGEAMGLQVQIRKVGRAVVLEAVGRLTLTDGHTKLRDAIHVSAGYGAKRFVLDLSHVEVIDSYGIGELVRCSSAVRQAGGDIKLAGVTEKVREMLEISRLNTFFEVHPNQKTALLAFGPPL